MRAQKELEDKNASMKECTFSPRLNTSGYHKRNLSGVGVDIKIYDRINYYKEKKHEKIDSIKQKQEDTKYQECRFHPEIVSN